MSLTTAQAVEIISSAGELIKLLSQGYEQLNAELVSLTSADDLTDAKLKELQDIVSQNALLTSGPVSEAGAPVEGNPTPVADAVIKAIDEMPVELPTDGVVETAMGETVDTTEETSSQTVAEAIDELVTAVESEGVESGESSDGIPVGESPTPA